MNTNDPKANKPAVKNAAEKNDKDEKPSLIQRLMRRFRSKSKKLKKEDPNIYPFY